MTINQAKPTGVALLDEVLAGAVPPGATFLATGAPSSGMELLAKEFAARAQNTLYYAPDESETEVEAVIRRFDKEAKPHVVDIASDYFQRVIASRHQQAAGVKVRGLRTVKAGRAPERAEFDVPDFLNEMLAEVIEKKPSRVVVDTLDFFFELYPPGDVIRAVRALRLASRKSSGLLYLGKVKQISDSNVDALLEHIADIVLEFNVKPLGQGFEFFMTVKKVRNEPHKTATVFYKPTKWGLTKDPRGRV